MCFFCIGYLILEVIEISTQGALAFIKNCVSTQDCSIIIVELFVSYLYLHNIPVSNA
mgnify:CR=1 FL=1